MIKTHELKTWPMYFRAIVEGKKNFEIRRDDRDFSPGDVLLLIEYERQAQHFTGAQVERKITYILREHEGLREGFAILGFE